MAAQASLKALWLRGNAGCLSAREQLKVWALRESWKEYNEGVYGMYSWISERVTKVGGGAPTTNSVKAIGESHTLEEDLKQCTMNSM